MAEIITGDTTKGIKNVGELALRISRFDSYRLFTLYENVKEGRVMNVSGDQKYYLVFKSPNKEIRIPEYDPKGDFEVDKVNGCILFKITKKNAEDILSMKTAGDKIFHIIRVFEEKDMFGKVLSVTDEVEVYNGKWGDDEAFITFSTENKVDLLTKSLAVQVDKNAKLLVEYNDLLENYNGEVLKVGDLEKELEALRAERDALQLALDEFTANTYDGTLLSTDTKYIAFEDTLDNIAFTEEQYNDAMNELMTKGEINIENYDLDDPRIELIVEIIENIKDARIDIYQIDIYQKKISLGSAIYGQKFYKTVYINHDDEFRFECTGVTYTDVVKCLKLEFEPVGGISDSKENNKYNQSVIIDPSDKKVIINKSGKTIITGKINFTKYSLDDDGNKIKEDINAVGNIGQLYCTIDNTTINNMPTQDWV